MKYAPKGFFLAFCVIVGGTFTVAWSILDGKLNLWMLLFMALFYGFGWLMTWLLRNNP